jgi:uncharacterized membrane protein YecN with MAPEG domain
MLQVWADPFRMVAFYIAINAAIMLALSLLVVRARVKTEVEIGDGGDPLMMGPLRAHGNNTEYVPVPLLLMLMTASLGGSFWLVHAIGLPLTLGRIVHGVGLSGNVGTSLLRFIGMILTWFAFTAGIVFCLWLIFLPPPAPAG